MPEMPRNAMYTGCRLDSLSWQMQRSGQLQATASLVAQGESRAGTAQTGTLATRPLKRFGNFNGQVTRDGSALSNLVSAQVTYANNIHRIETIGSDGRIELRIAAQTGALLIWVDKDMTWRAPCDDGRPGRPAVFSDGAGQFCLSIKVLFKLPLRQAAAMVASLLKLAGLDWPVPDFSALCRRQKTLAVQVPCRRADGPLNLLVDSTGIKFFCDGEWQARKLGVQGSTPGENQSYM